MSTTQNLSNMSYVSINGISEFNNSITWHDDCSSIEVWTENTTNVENQVQYYQSGVPLLTNGTGIYSDTIPGYASDLHGIQYFKKLETPMKICNNLDFRVEVYHIGTPNMAGSVGVVLFDENNASVFKAGGVDGWLGSTCNAWVAYKENGIQTTEYNTMSGAWSGIVRVWYDFETSSIRGEAAGSEFVLASTGEFNRSREVHWVGIVFYNMQFYAYESHIVTDISLSATSDEGFTSWYSNCSDHTVFDGLADDNWYGNPSVHIDGSINSIDDYIYADDYGSGAESHGPMMYHTLTSPFKFSRFVALEAEIEVDAVADSRLCGVAVVLFDEYNNTILAINVADSWTSSSNVAAYSNYDHSNGTRYVTPYELPTWITPTPYYEVIKVIQNTTGLYAFVPRIGNFLVVQKGGLELNRTVSYIAVNFRAWSSDPVCETVRIHDILLTIDDPPAISPPNDITYEAGSTGRSITWNVFDRTPGTYQVFRNGAILVGNDWDGSPIIIQIGGLYPGVYEYILNVTDTLDSYSTDSVIVTVVDTTGPLVSNPIDIEFILGTSGHTINWSASELYPENWSVYVNGTFLISDSWNGSDVLLPIDNLEVGIYNYTIIFEDESGNTGVDVVFVSVREPPILMDGFLTLSLVIGGVLVIIIIVVIRKRS
ncbi:MAG: hypothetical protein ACFFCX_16310 [Candidatus Sifarchaeia archaeon]